MYLFNTLITTFLIHRFDQDEQDEIVDLTAVTLEESDPAPFVTSKDDGQVLHL